jgi:hypothetical protein
MGNLFPVRILLTFRWQTFRMAKITTGKAAGDVLPVWVSDSPGGFPTNQIMKTLPLFLGLLLAVGVATPASSQFLLNPGFETPVITDAQGFDNFATAPAGFGWTIAAGNIDIVRGYFPAYEGQQCVDLTGFMTGRIYQDVTFATAGRYRVDFAFAGNPATTGIRHMRVDFGLAGQPLSTIGSYTYDTTGHTIADFDWRAESSMGFDVVSDTLYRLQFASLDGGSYGPRLDDVRFAAVPEPSSTGLLMLAALLFTARSRPGSAPKNTIVCN